MDDARACRGGIPENGRGRATRALSLGATIGALLVLAHPAPVAAHPLVEAGVEQANQAEFEEALHTFEEAWVADGLRRDDVVLLLSERAIVHFALRADDELDRDLRLLAALAPDFRFAANVPPPLSLRFDQLRAHAGGAPEVSVAVHVRATSVAFDVRVTGLPEGLVRDVRVSARALHDRWVAGFGTEVELPIESSGDVEWYVEVIGPGGAVILNEGAVANPRRSIRASSLVGETRNEGTNDASPNRRARRGWAIGATSVAAVAITSVLLVVMRGNDDATRVAGPVIR